MPQEKVTVTFKKGGKVVVEGHGFKGGTCDKALESFEKAVGKKKKQTLKPEYYEQNTEKKKQTW